MSELMKPELELTKQAPVAIAKQPGLKTTTTVLRGPWETILGLCEDCRVGFDAPTRIEGAAGRVAAVSATRQNGGLGTLELTMSERETTEVWNLDFMEIQKPIRAWHADAENEEDRPDLFALASWERLKDLDGAWKAYQGFYTSTEMSSSTQLTGATLTLAQKILKGVEAFNVYAPILTMMVLSFNASKSRTQWGGFTLEWYAQMFDSRSIMSEVKYKVNKYTGVEVKNVDVCVDSIVM